MTSQGAAHSIRVFPVAPRHVGTVETSIHRFEGIGVRSRIIAGLSILLAVGCAAARPDPFLIPENELTYAQGEEMLRSGEAMVADGNRQISDGRDLREQADEMIKEGRERRKEGEEIAKRGRAALRAARMLEEAEALRRKSDALKGEAIPE